MTNLGETALQSPVVMTIRHVSGAGMNCLFRCLVIILGLIFEEVEGGVSGLRKKLADFIEKNPDHEVSGGSTGETFAIKIRREFNMSVPGYCTAMRDERRPMMGGAIEIDAFVILYPETYIVTFSNFQVRECDVAPLRGRRQSSLSRQRTGRRAVEHGGAH